MVDGGGAGVRGEDAALCFWSGASHWELVEGRLWPIHVAMPPGARRSPKGVKPHPRILLPHEITEHRGIPVATVPVVITDLATTMRRGPLEGVVNQASIRGLIAPPDLRSALDEMPRRPGRKTLRETLDRATFRFTRSQLERAFIPIALKAGFSRPATCVEVNGWEVDFYWPELDFVVEADSLTYHRTPQQQARDRLRDQAHASWGCSRGSPAAYCTRSGASRSSSGTGSPTTFQKSPSIDSTSAAPRPWIA
jgi:hypothetical protein